MMIRGGGWLAVSERGAGVSSFMQSGRDGRSAACSSCGPFMQATHASAGSLLRSEALTAPPTSFVPLRSPRD